MEKELPVGLRFSILDRYFRRRMDALLRERDLTGVQFGVLGQLHRLECGGSEEVNQRDLESATRVTHPTMTEIVKRLEKQGFVECGTSLRDRRYKSIRSTEKAGDLLKEHAELDAGVFQALCRGLSDEEIRALLCIMDKMLENACSGCQKGSDGV